MFGKIKGKFKNILKKTEEVIKEDEEEELIEELEEENLREYKEVKDDNLREEGDDEEKKDDESPTKEKKGFFKKIFSKSNEEKEDNEESKENKEVIVEEQEDLENIGIKKKDNIENKKENTSEKIKKKEENREKIKEKENIEINKNDKESFLKKAFSKISKRKITEEDFDKIWEEIEIYLLDINIAFDVCEKIREQLKNKLIDKEFTIFTLKETILETLISEVKNILKERESNFLEKLKEELKNNKPIKILMLGINGTGKTTTIAKLHHFLKKENISSVVSASDTFRAAAIEQLEEHSKKLGFKLIKHEMGSDPAAVAFDTVKHAESKGIDIVIIDSAGRMANNKNLMEELNKVKRVIKPNFIIFVGDSNSGSDLIEQINLFDQKLGIDGVILTKVDTDERPGSIVTTAYTIEKPIYFIGVGQNYNDLIEFNSEEVAKELFE